MPKDDSNEQGQPDVRTYINVGLTLPDDPTVGGGGWEYAGIGNGQLPAPLKQYGARKRKELFPGH